MELLKNFSPPPGYCMPQVKPRWPLEYEASAKERYVETVVNQRTWAGDEEGPLRLMSYNILADSCLENHQFPNIPENDLHLGKRTEFVLAEIAALSPDLVAL
jgi:mRNA deadenylase 3'-5' endonuclease subunit Ccr4